MKTILSIVLLLAAAMGLNAQAVQKAGLANKLDDSSQTVYLYANAIPQSLSQGYVYVDTEVLRVLNATLSPSVVTGNSIVIVTVQRGTFGTTSAVHLAGTVVFYGYPSQFVAVDPQGPCVPYGMQYLNYADSQVFSCGPTGAWFGVTTSLTTGTGSIAAPPNLWPSWLVPGISYPANIPTLGVTAGIVPVANGGTGTSIARPTIYSADYAFTTPNFAQALTAGTPATVTLAISPIGVNGTDTFHPIYIPGANAEAVIITGGTCTSAALNCTLIFTPANNHASGWHFQSADAGINEALQVCATAGGGITQAPAGTITLHGIMDHKSGCSQFGQGIDTTILQVAAGEFASVQGWQAAEYGYAVDRSANGSGVTRSGYTIDMQGSTQTSVPTNTGTVVEWFNQNESLATQVGVIHSPNPANFLPFLMFGTSANNTIQFSKVIDDPLTSCTNTGAGGYFIQTSGAGNKVLSSYGEAGCQAMFQAGTNAAAGTYAYDTYNIGATTMAAGGQQFDVDSSGPGWQFIGNKCFGNGSAPTCYAAISDDPTIETVGTSFTDNDAINPGFCYQIAGQGNTKFTRDTEIKGGYCSHPGTAGMILQDGVNGLSVTNWHQDGGGITPNGVFVNTQTAGAMLNINFGTSNLIKQNTNGIFITGASGIVPADGFSLVGSTITANTNGLVLPSSTPIGHFNISLNNIWENTSDYTFGMSGGAAALVQQGVGTFGPNVTTSAPAYGLASIHQGSDSNVAGAVTLANGLNSNVTTDVQGSIEAAGPTSAYSVGGFTNPHDGYDLLFFSANAQALTIVNEDTSSTATNRIYTYTGGGTTATPNVTLTPSSGQNVYAHFHYSFSKGRWLLLDHS